MDIESPYWDMWEQQFTALATQAELTQTHAHINTAAHYLCLHGENGMSEEAEMKELAAMQARVSEVKKVEVDTSYWQEIVLFIP